MRRLVPLARHHLPRHRRPSLRPGKSCSRENPFRSHLRTPRQYPSRKHRFNRRRARRSRQVRLPRRSSAPNRKRLRPRRQSAPSRTGSKCAIRPASASRKWRRHWKVNGRRSGALRAVAADPARPRAVEAAMAAFTGAPKCPISPRVFRTASMRYGATSPW